MDVNEKAKKTVRVRFAAARKFSPILNSLRDHYKSAGKQDWLATPYIVTCAAALEAKLNDELVEYAHRKWDWDDPAFAQSLLTMTFRSKLHSLVPLLTDHRFQFNRDHFVYKRLSSLISVRNVLVHPKPIEKELPISEKLHPFDLPMPEGYYELVEDITLGAIKTFDPLDYHDAIEKLDKWFFRRVPDRLDKLAMLVPNKCLNSK